LIESGNQSILREVFGKADIAHHPHQAGNDFGGLNPPNSFDGAMDVGSRHLYPSHHL